MTLSWRAFLKGLRDLHLAENLQSTYTYQLSTSRRSLDVAIFVRKRKRCWHSQQSVDWKLLVGSCQLTFKRLQVWHPSERSGPPCHPACQRVTQYMLWYTTILELHIMFFTFPVFECLNKSILGLGGLIDGGCAFRSIALNFHGLEWHPQWEPWNHGCFSSAWPKRSSFLRPRTLYRFCSGFCFMDVRMIQTKWEWLQRHQCFLISNHAFKSLAPPVWIPTSYSTSEIESTAQS